MKQEIPIARISSLVKWTGRPMASAYFSAAFTVSIAAIICCRQNFDCPVIRQDSGGIGPFFFGGSGMPFTSRSPSCVSFSCRVPLLCCVFCEGLTVAACQLNAPYVRKLPHRFEIRFQTTPLHSERRYG